MSGLPARPESAPILHCSAFGQGTSETPGPLLWRFLHDLSTCGMLCCRHTTVTWKLYMFCCRHTTVTTKLCMYSWGTWWTLMWRTSMVRSHLLHLVLLPFCFTDSRWRAICVIVETVQKHCSLLSFLLCFCCSRLAVLLFYRQSVSYL